MATIADTELEQSLTEDEVAEAVRETLVRAQVDLNTLRQEAATGRFQSERHRRAWFVVRGLGCE